MADYDLIVIGAGPGGYVAAIRAAQLGMNVACVEKEESLGGTCLNIGCIPSKALLNSSEKYIEFTKHAEEHGIKSEKINLDLSKLMLRKDNIVKKLTSGVGFLFKKNKITHLKGNVSFVDKNNIKIKSSKEIIISAKNFIIATGSSAIDIPSIPIDEKNIVSSTGALSLSSVPKTMLVVGGGYIGLEMGSVWSRLGSKVMVIEALNRIVPNMDGEIASQYMKSLQKQGLEFKLLHKLISAKSNKNEVEVEIQSLNDNKKSKEKFNIVLMSVGRKPNTEGLGLEKIGIKLNDQKSIKIDKQYKTNVEGIYAIGDVAPGPMLAHKAEEEGVACVEIINGQKSHINYDTIPAIVYTNPEIAWAGLTETEAKANAIKVEVTRYPWAASGRAQAIGATDGLTKLLIDPDTDRVLGCGIVGVGAGELIAEAVLAIEMGCEARDITEAIHPHPTLSETVMNAGELFFGSAVEMYKPKRS